MQVDDLEVLVDERQDPASTAGEVKKPVKPGYIRSHSNRVRFLWKRRRNWSAPDEEEISQDEDEMSADDVGLVALELVELLALERSHGFGSRGFLPPVLSLGLLVAADPLPTHTAQVGEGQHLVCSLVDGDL